MFGHLQREHRQEFQALKEEEQRRKAEADHENQVCNQMLHLRLFLLSAFSFKSLAFPNGDLLKT